MKVKTKVRAGISSTVAAALRAALFKRSCTARRGRAASPVGATDETAHTPWAKPRALGTDRHTTRSRS